MRDGRAFSNKLVPVLTSGKKLAQKSCAFFLHYLGFRCFLKHLQFREGDVMCSNNFHRMQRKWVEVGARCCGIIKKGLFFFWWGTPGGPPAGRGILIWTLRDELLYSISDVRCWQNKFGLSCDLMGGIMQVHFGFLIYIKTSLVQIPTWDPSVPGCDGILSLWVWWKACCQYRFLKAIPKLLCIVF